MGKREWAARVGEFGLLKRGRKRYWVVWAQFNLLLFLLFSWWRNWVIWPKLLSHFVLFVMIICFDHIINNI